jgi:carbon monoxide dehydrogenase subunit G
MPKVTRSRVVAADQARVWDLISDPHNLPRWWPRVVRVEDVHDPGGKRARWTAVLGTERGTGVRADFRCTGSTSAERYAWEQDIEGSPFERVLKSSTVELRLRPVDGRTEVTVAGDETLRGLSRLGASMLKGAARRRLDEALDGIENALVGERSDA